MSEKSKGKFNNINLIVKYSKSCLMQLKWQLKGDVEKYKQKNKKKIRKIQ